MRSAAIFAVAIVAAALCCGRALAITEYCPATVNVFPLVSPTPAPGAAYPAARDIDMSFMAETPKTISGNVVMHTDTGWYLVPFSNVELTKYAENWKTPSAQFSRTSYRSKFLRVAFADPVSILAAYVGDANHVTCAGAIDSPLHAHNEQWYNVHLLNPPLPTTVASSLDAAITPLPYHKPGSTDCERPFANVGVLQAAQPNFPMDINDPNPKPGLALIEVAINAKGELDDAWLWGTSGNSLYDDAALNAARSSVYSPARAFCENVPGVHLFRVQFMEKEDQ